MGLRNIQTPEQQKAKEKVGLLKKIQNLARAVRVRVDGLQQKTKKIRPRGFRLKRKRMRYNSKETRRRNRSANHRTPRRSFV